MANIHNATASIHKLEDLATKKTIIHDLHPGVKIITTFVFLVAVISFNRYTVGLLLPYLVYIIIVMALAEIPYKLLFSRVLIALPFSLFAGISNIIFDRTGAFLFYGITVTYGMISFVSIMLKTILCVSSILILISTTSMTQLSYQLTRMKIPGILVMQITMTYRYISVLLEEAGTMYTAYLLRTPKEKGIRMKDMGTFVGQLLLRSIDRAERVYYAMKCRGFRGAANFSVSRSLKSSHVIYTIIISAAFVLFRIYNIPQLIGGLF